LILLYAASDFIAWDPDIIAYFPVWKEKENWVQTMCDESSLSNHAEH